jgi:hypothetical protein
MAMGKLIETACANLVQRGDWSAEISANQSPA